MACVECVWVWLGVVQEGNKWIRRLGLDFTSPVGKAEIGRMSVFWLRWCTVGRRLGPGSGRMWWSYVFVSCESGSFG